MGRILIADDDPGIRLVIERALQQGGHHVVSCTTLKAARQALDHEPRPELLILDLKLGDGNGLQLLGDSRNLPEPPAVIVVTAYSDLDNAVAAYRGGAFELIAKPFDLTHLRQTVDRALRDADRHSRPRPAAPDEEPLLGTSPAMRELFRMIGRLSTTDVNVLLTGATGTGKERVARALHRHSPRSGGPFVAINTAAIPAELLESELFGHERGAFTGATGRRDGRFAQAAGGTLLLDEIGDMPLAMQTRLLRVLAEGEYFRVGGHELCRIDVRIIAATHQDLAAHVAAGRFRADLYHRLNVIRIDVPPLAARRQDIPQLTDYFLAAAARHLGTAAKRFTDEALGLLARAPWPGNVRELKNLCQQMSVLAPGERILPADLPPEYRLDGMVDAAPAAPPVWQEHLRHWALDVAESTPPGCYAGALNEAEQVLIECALEASSGHRQKAAALLGWGRNTLARKIKEQASAPENKGRRPVVDQLDLHRRTEPAARRGRP